MRIAVLVLLYLFVATGFAQVADNQPADAEDAADSNATQEQPEELQDSDAESDQAQASPEEEADARFIPTEEISQDLGVSFPVDI